MSHSRTAADFRQQRRGNPDDWEFTDDVLILKGTTLSPPLQYPLTSSHQMEMINRVHEFETRTRTAATNDNNNNSGDDPAGMLGPASRIVVEHDLVEGTVLISEVELEREPMSVPEYGFHQFVTTPAPESVIEGLERLEIGGVMAGREEGDCAICLEEMEESGGERVIIRMGCGHMFHESCSVSWLRVSNFCPLCRFLCS